MNANDAVELVHEIKTYGMLESCLDPLQPFLDDDSITEICVNRPNEVWTESVEGWIRHEIPYGLNSRECQTLATLIGTANSKKITFEYPVLSGSLPSGERVQVLIPPACEKGTVSITIRKPSLVQKSLEQLDEEGSFKEYRPVVNELSDTDRQLMELRKTGQIKEFLKLAVQTRQNILIVGGTGAGKTTITKTLTQSIPSEERIITIEDVHELILPNHPNRVHLFYARSDEGGAKVSAKQALASCLRMKPDRILLAELRGDEAWEFIKSVNTGHPGVISTMHANGALETFEQLTALIKDSPTGSHLDSDYIKHRIYTTIDIVLFYQYRKLREIYYDPEHKRKLMA